MDFLNAFVALSNFVLVPAIAYGSQLALGALGVTLIYGILRFSNFAHGDTMAFGAMIAVLVTWGLQAAGIGFGPLPTALLALPFAILGCIVLVLITDRLVSPLSLSFSFYHRGGGYICGSSSGSNRDGSGIYSSGKKKKNCIPCY